MDPEFKKLLDKMDRFFYPEKHNIDTIKHYKAPEYKEISLNDFLREFNLGFEKKKEDTSTED
jgi:hypothetical protein